MERYNKIPAIYNPEVPYNEKCAIVLEMCKTAAKKNKISMKDMRLYLIDKIKVDFEHLENNQIGLLLLYEYLNCQNNSKFIYNSGCRLH